MIGRIAAGLILVGRFLWPFARETKSEKAGMWITMLAAGAVAVGMALSLC